MENETPISEYYIDSVERDNDSQNEKRRILNKLEKMDPIFAGIKVKTLKDVEAYDSLNNRFIIKQSKEYEYIDFDGSIKINVENETQIIDLNGIKEVEVKREDTGTSWGACCCKTWKIMYRIFHINQNGEKIEAKNPIEYWHRHRGSDISKAIRFNELKILYRDNKYDL